MDSQIISVQEARQLMAGHINNGYELAGLYDYTYPDGRPVYCRIRIKRGAEKKIFPVHRGHGDQLFLKEPTFSGQKKPIYRLHDLTYRTDEVVFVVEGEGCVDKLLDMGILATTSGGSSSAKSAEWSPLKGRKIVLWPDADHAGTSYGCQVTEALLQIGCSVQWVDISRLNMLEGGDCVDWANKNPSFTAAEVLQLPLIDPPGNDDIQPEACLHLGYPRFELRNGDIEGVHYCRDVQHSIWLCSPLKILALTRDSQSDNWGRVLEFTDADGMNHQWTMPMEMLSSGGEDLCRELLRLGLRIAPGAAPRKLLIEYITAFETNNRARCVLVTGWHRDCFVLPQKVYGKASETILLQTDIRASANYGTQGSLSDWQENVSVHCLGNSRLVFAVSLALAPPLLRLLGAENGGFHFRGESSSGKSTALCMAASVWGGPNYVQNWRATDNGLEGLAAQHNDTLLVLDELSQIDSRCAGEVAYMLANGQGKARSSRTGIARQRYAWRLLFLSSGEISLSSHMLEAGKRSRAGQEIRMVYIPADCGSGMGIFEDIHGFDSPGVFADHLKGVGSRYFGIAGDAFLEKLTAEDQTSFRTKIHDIQVSFMKNFTGEFHGQTLRVAHRFALVAAAGEIATELGITGWKRGDALSAAKKCFDGWLASKDGGTLSYERDSILSHVRHFFQENAARFDTFDNVSDRIKNPIPPRCAGYRSSSGNFYVYPVTFTQEICKGLGSPKDVAKIVTEAGWLIPDAKKDTLYSSHWTPTVGKTMRFYHFSGAVIGEDDKI